MAPKSGSLTLKYLLRQSASKRVFHLQEFIKSITYKNIFIVYIDIRICTSLIQNSGEKDFFKLSLHQIKQPPFVIKHLQKVSIARRGA
jgi:hypothetical protein